MATSSIGIVDYGMGNLRSVQKAFEKVGAQAEIVREPRQIAESSKLILPGVGAFEDAIATLHQLELVDPILKFVASGRPFLGICLGLQLLFERSEEGGEHEGLGIVPGSIVRFNPTDHTLKVPHMGWNTLTLNRPDSPLMQGLPDEAAVYFVHSYYAAPTDEAVVATTTEYDGPFCSAIHHENVMAVQFHPEKSQKVGLKMLANFAEL
ncbi:MAG: imidazole glycerol phosphate synthase subunit HisH [Phycisphaeraceae bacterium]